METQSSSPSPTSRHIDIFLVTFSTLFVLHDIIQKQRQENPSLNLKFVIVLYPFWLDCVDKSYLDSLDWGQNILGFPRQSWDCFPNEVKRNKDLMKWKHVKEARDILIQNLQTIENVDIVDLRGSDDGEKLEKYHDFEDGNTAFDIKFESNENDNHVIKIGDFIRNLADIRYIYSLVQIPNPQKLKISEQLSEYGFTSDELSGLDIVNAAEAYFIDAVVPKHVIIFGTGLTTLWLARDIQQAEKIFVVGRENSKPHLPCLSSNLPEAVWNKIKPVAINDFRKEFLKIYPNESNSTQKAYSAYGYLDSQESVKVLFKYDKFHGNRADIQIKTFLNLNEHLTFVAPANTPPGNVSDHALRLCRYFKLRDIHSQMFLRNNDFSECTLTLSHERYNFSSEIGFLQRLQTALRSLEKPYTDLVKVMSIYLNALMTDDSVAIPHSEDSGVIALMFEYFQQHHGDDQADLHVERHIEMNNVPLILQANFKNRFK